MPDGKLRLSDYSDVRFALDPAFVKTYSKTKPNFGFGVMGELTYLRTYSRIKEDGTQERWHETVERVVNGVFTILLRHFHREGKSITDSDLQKITTKAVAMYDKIFNFKFLPPGRGLWSMGSKTIEERGIGAAAYNCAFFSTEDMWNPSTLSPFEFMADALMLGVGVGFDTRGAGTTIVLTPEPENGMTVFAIPDTREGWAKSIAVLIDSYLVEGSEVVEFDYSLIRPYGSPILGFGGVASGPEPLHTCHNQIRQALDSNSGKWVTERLIVDLMNFIGVCVVAGNTRRSATIALGTNSEEFLDLKNYAVNPERAAYGWTSNNSVLMEYPDSQSEFSFTDIAERIVNNGEPGVIWLDRIREFSRLGDDPDFKDIWAYGSNPCARYDTLLLTKEYGLRKIGELAHNLGGFHVWGETGWCKSSAWSSGEKEIFRVTLTDGREIILTGDHVVQVRERHKKTYVLRDSVVSELLGKHVAPFLGDGTWDGREDILPEDAVFFGLVQGDGTFHTAGKFSVCFRNKEREVIEFLQRYAEDRGFKISEWTDGTLVVRGENLETFLTDFGFNFEILPTRKLPSKLYAQSPEIVKAFLRGLYSANGTTKHKQNRISLKTTCFELAQGVQRLLSALGLHSYISTNAPKENSWENGTYTSKESYDLNIGSLWGFQKFQREIGFLHTHKGISEYRDPIRRYEYAKASIVKSITPLGVEEVFDFEEPISNWGWANGIKIHNCAEISLHHGELCNLVELFPNHHDNIFEFIETAELAFLYAKTVTLLDLHWPIVEQKVHANRRLGVSMTGLTQFIAKHGELELRSWCDLIYDYLRALDGVVSKWFGVNKSIKITSVKPSGTVSLVAGATPGVHFPESEYYIRRIRLASNSEFVPLLKKAGYPIEDDVYSLNTVVVEFPIFAGEGVRSVRDVSLAEQINLCTIMQTHWSDNMVSATLTFKPGEKAVQDISHHLEHSRLKNLSFLPLLDEGSYQQMVYQHIEKEEYERRVAELKPVNFYRSGGVHDHVDEKFCDGDSCTLDLTRVDKA